MKQLLLLWLVTSGTLIVVFVLVVLALGAVFALVRLAWKLVVWRPLRAGGVRGAEQSSAGAAEPSGFARVSGRVRPPGAQRPVRVQAGLVPSSFCVARGDLDGVPRRGRRGSR